MPVVAIHAPVLLFTQRVWGTEPWGKLERSAEMAAAVGAEVVVVHPPFRWQREYARDFVNGIAALEESSGHRVRGREHVPVAGVAARGRDVPAGLGPLDRAVREHHDRPLARRDRRTTTRSRWPTGSASGCGTCTSPTAPARPRTSTSCPGRGDGRCRGVPAPPRRHRLRRRDRRRDQHPQGSDPGRARGRPAGVPGLRPGALPGGADLMPEPATSSRRGRRPGWPDTRPRSSPSPSAGWPSARRPCGGVPPDYRRQPLHAAPRDVA